MSDRPSTPTRQVARGSYAPSAARAVEAHSSDDQRLNTDPLRRAVDVAHEHPQLVAERMWREYIRDSTISRNLNQVVEQVMADAYVRPAVDQEAVSDALSIWWRQQKMDLRMPTQFKSFLISGEQWGYVPITRTRSGRGVNIPLRDLTPWYVTEITGWSWYDWQQATYRTPRGRAEIALNPENTTFFAHDAMFENLRGLTPFASMLFAAARYRAYLDGRERVNRLAGVVTGELNFETVEDAAAVLGWQKDAEGNIIPETVYLPADGTVAVTVGNSRFDVKTANVNAAGSDPDGRRFFMNMIEAGRLPEYASGDGGNVNVATARVQYPLAVRFMLALRDEFEYAMTETMRLVLGRMAAVGYIPGEWTATRADGTTEPETPATATIRWSWPEIRELDFEVHFNSLMTLVDKALLDDERAMSLLGYDPEEDMPDPEERERRRQSGINLARQLGGGNEEEGLKRIQQAVRYAITTGLASAPKGDATSD